MDTPRRLSRGVLLGSILLLGLAGPAHGQRPARRRAYLAAEPRQDSVLRLGSTLTFEARDLPPGAARHLTLYLNGLPLRGLAPLAVYIVADTAAPAAGAVAVRPPGGSWPDSAAAAAALPPVAPVVAEPRLTRVVFALRREAAPTAWALADGPPWQAAHSVRLGLGSPTQLLAELRQASTLAPASGWLAGLAGATLAGVLLLVLAARSWLLRTPVAATGADGYPLAVAEAAPPYSLARTQLAWWSFLVLGGGLVSGSVLGGLPALPAGTLALLGVSLGTAALAALAPPPEPAEAAQSRGWLADLLSDQRGLAMPRLQFVLVALAMGSCLARVVYATGTLPAWPPGPALLLAFSSLAYLAPKWQGRRPAAPAELAAYPAVPAAPAVPEGLAYPTVLEPAGPGVVAGAPVASVPASPPPPPVADAPVAPAAALGVAAVPAPGAPPARAATPVAAPPVAPAPAIEATPPASEMVLPVDTPGGQSRADFETGEVLYHEEDDMGPLEEADYLSQPVAG